MLGLMLASASCVPVWESEAPLSFDEPAVQAPAAGLAARPAHSSNLLSSLFANSRPSAFRGRTALDQLRSLNCLAEAIYYEAASESENGQRAVAQVVLNRVRHPAWPNSVCGVVYQGPMRPGGGCQFTFTCDGSLRVRPAGLAWARARVLAAEALAGSVFAPVGLSTHYHTHAVSPAWAPALTKTIVIGAHIFYRLPGSVGATAAFNAAYSGREPLPHPTMTLIRRTDIAAVLPPGLTLPRTSRQQWSAGRHVEVEGLRPGDLVFWAHDPADPSTIHHVGMYVGQGLMVHAPHTGALVRVDALRPSGYAGATRPPRAEKA